MRLDGHIAFKPFMLIGELASEVVRRLVCNRKGHRPHKNSWSTSIICLRCGKDWT